jgi:hypothetical protein
MYSGDLAGEFGSWEVGVPLGAIVNGGAYSKTTTAGESTYIFSATITGE